MTPSPEDLAFVRFCRTGAPEALAQVFDRTAGQLLLVAMHLTRDGALAEDLVQGTFVAAIQSADGFAPGRRVLPWLLGILAHLASGARRQAARAARGPGRPGLVADTPLAALLSAEVRDEVARALAALPETYRTVLDLRLVHGLRSAQIARSLGRSPETVRTQVRRGLEHLRRLLPRGLAVPVAVLAFRGRGLAAVRSAVLAQARVAPVTVFSGAWLLVVLAALWAVASSLWVSTATSAPVAEVAVAGGAQGAPSPAQAQSRVAVPEPTGAMPVPAAGASGASANVPGRIRGRCVADESGEPIAGVRARFGMRPSFAVAGEGRSDGRFALAFPTAGATEFVLTLDGPERARLSCAFPTWPSGQELDLGDVRMPRGTELCGRIRDSDARIVSGAVLTVRNTSLNQQSLPVGNQPGTVAFRSARSDDQGRWRCDGRLEPGTWAIEVARRSVTEPRTITVEGHEHQVDLDVVVAAQDPARAIHGRFVDDQGQPFGAVRVWLQGSSRRFDERLSDEHGAFVLPYEVGFPERPALRFEHAEAVPNQGARAAIAWGTQDLVVTLARQPKQVETTAEVAIEVVDAAGSPVEDFALRCCPDPRQTARWSAQLGALGMAGHHPGGRVVVTASTRWRNALFVEPKDPKLLPAGPVFFRGDEGPVRVVVRTPAALRVRVQTSAGLPVAGTRIELLRPWTPELVTPVTGTVPLRDPWGVLQPALWAVSLGEGVTGADGVATFTAAAGETGLAVRSLGPRNLPLVQHGIVAGPEVVVVTADPGATLSGRVLGWDAVRRGYRRAALTLCRRGIGLFSGDGAVPDADGNYRFEGIVGGPWDVHLFFVPEPGMALAKGVREHPQRVETPLASVLLDQQPQTLDLDARPFAPGRIAGRLLLEGKPLPYTRWLDDLEGKGNVGLSGGTTDADGRFTLDPALPGPHWIVIQWTPPSGGERLRLLANEPIRVAPGEQVEATVDLDRKKAGDPFRALRQR